MTITPTVNKIPKRFADFDTLSAALDYAASGTTGINFYERGKFKSALTYAELREQSIKLARKLSSLDLARGSRMALLAETDPNFHIFFFACQYAGLIPVPIPVQFRLDSKNENIEHTKWLIESSGASLAMAPQNSLQLLMDSIQDLNFEIAGNPEFFNNLPENKSKILTSLEANETAYLQFTSGSTREPYGVQITQDSVMNNLVGITKHGLKVNQSDRCVSWLPFYHDMGLVGFVLGPMASQISVDYFSPQDFVMRPQNWISLISSNKATISFAPPFGYELCARRLKRQSISQYELSSWRIAGLGADSIQPEPLKYFADLLEPCGFDKSAFLACYGLAECSLAVSFAPLGQGLEVDYSNKRLLLEKGISLQSTNNDTEEVAKFVKCGKPLPDLEVQVCDENGKKLLERHCGELYVRGPSIMKGYVDKPWETQKAITSNGWLNTGDLAYIADEEIVIIGRNKDMILINGKNIWPQDLESIATQNSEVRTNDAIAFSVSDSQGNETPVVEVQSREKDPQKCQNLIKNIKTEVYKEIGIKCYVELVPLHTLPRTTSGKPSRSKAKKQFLQKYNDLCTIFANQMESLDTKKQKSCEDNVLN